MRRYRITASWTGREGRREEWTAEATASHIRIAISRGLKILASEMHPRNPRRLSLRAEEIPTEAEIKQARQGGD